MCDQAVREETVTRDAMEGVAKRRKWGGQVMTAGCWSHGYLAIFPLKVRFQDQQLWHHRRAYWK